jgi:N-acetylated-alpha-linked acidic dipeptidase
MSLFVFISYQKIFRGNKAWFAQQRGAIGIVIYSDPIDDGYLRGPVYPEVNIIAKNAC